MTSAPATPMAFVQQESCLCTQCQAQIPREFVVAQIKTQETGPTRQRVRAWCEHCKAMFECNRELRGGHWQITGTVEIVTDESRRKALLNRLKHQRGIIDNAAA